MRKIGSRLACFMFIAEQKAIKCAADPSRTAHFLTADSVIYVGANGASTSSRMALNRQSVTPIWKI
ncbi:hypothetical protein CWC28_06995 [Pseudoalteromonas sp. S4492]|nr:hypothetical protein CWC28_06995 [Pseudoalteromonas sp. S4492]